MEFETFKGSSYNLSSRVGLKDKFVNGTHQLVGAGDKAGPAVRVGEALRLILFPFLAFYVTVNIISPLPTRLFVT